VGPGVVLEQGERRTVLSACPFWFRRHLLTPVFSQGARHLSAFSLAGVDSFTASLPDF